MKSIWKQFSLMTLVLVFTSSQVFAAEASGLKQAFDEFQYSMEVEGAAATVEGQTAATEKLQQDLKALNLSHEEMIAQAIAQLKDQKLAQELKEILAQVNIQNLSQKEILDQVKAAFERSYHAGASWSGAATAGVVIAGLVVVVVVVLASTGGKDENFIDWEWDL